MAGLCWMAVILVFFLSTENSLAVDQKRLADFVTGILRTYQPNGMFSLAVSIPEDQNQRTDNILKKVYESDPSKNVWTNNNSVYKGNRVVAAKVLKRATGGADHAEYRVAGHLDVLAQRHNKNDLLIFYVYASPCVEKCTSETHAESILNRIVHVKDWNSCAFVFSKIFKPRYGQPNTEEELSGALERLGSVVGLSNIFRCDKNNRNMQCTRCFSDNKVTRACVSDNTNPDPSQSQPQQGSSGSGTGSRGGMGRNRRDSGRGWGMGRNRRDSGRGWGMGRNRRDSGRGWGMGRGRRGSRRGWGMGRNRRDSGRGWGMGRNRRDSGRGWGMGKL